MLVRCPKCRTESRPFFPVGNKRAISYFCPGCQSIVRIDPKKDAVETTSPAAPVARNGKRRILVADDNSRVRDFAAGILRSAGYEVLEAEDGPGALGVIEAERPDLILLNLMMPLMTGFDVVTEIKKDDQLKNIPIFLISDVVSDREVLGTLEHYGITGFINKREIKDWLLLRVQETLSK